MDQQVKDSLVEIPLNEDTLDENFLIGVGHPLLDVSINCEEKELINYNLKADDAILARPEHKNLIEECFKKYSNDLKLISGGATQNSIRVAQWVFNFYKQKRTVFLGTVGDDLYANLLEQQAKKEKVKPLYCKIKEDSIDKNNNEEVKDQNNINELNVQKINKELNVQKSNHELNVQNSNQELNALKTNQELDVYKTGICIGLNTNSGLCRSLVTFLGAAKMLNKKHIIDNLENLKNSNLIYIGGFILSSSFDAFTELIKFSKENNKKLALNLNAAYICSTFGELVCQVLPNVDILFGNEQEFKEFSIFNKFETEKLEEIVEKLFEKFPVEKEQLIVITQNKNAVLLFKRSDKSCIKQEVPLIEKEKIVDTIGAGDAFAGGFLSFYLMNKSLDQCLKCGIYCARKIICVSGCNINFSEFNEDQMHELFK